MSEIAAQERFRKQSWAAPGGFHDLLVRVLKIALPAMIGLLMAYLAMAPLTRTQEISFILDKNKVAVAKERMRVETAQYRGRDMRGRAFTIGAKSAVQLTSDNPIVDIRGMAANIQLDQGPATLHAATGRYNLETQDVGVIGPVFFTGPDNYQLNTRDVTVDLNQQTMRSEGRVDGTMRLGNFTADRLNADLRDRRVILTGRARLHIVQGGIR